MTQSDQNKPTATEDHAADDEKSLGPMQVIGSIFAAGLGVQSSKNRERDFKQGRFGIFIAAGLIFTLLFIATIATIVTMVVSKS